MNPESILVLRIVCMLNGLLSMVFLGCWIASERSWRRLRARIAVYERREKEEERTIALPGGTLTLSLRKDGGVQIHLPKVAGYGVDSISFTPRGTAELVQTIEELRTQPNPHRMN